MADPALISDTRPGALRYLSAAVLEDCLPAVDERLELAGRALVALSRDEAEMPPKIGVHPRPGALIHAMPAWLRGSDVAGLKWIAAFPDNRRLGLPAINGLVVLNDAATGLPAWVMEAGRITAVRTAAVSGVAVRLFAPRARSVAILGIGVQARSHLEVVGNILPAARVTLFDRHPERAAAAAREHNEERGREWAVTADSPRRAVHGADVVITVATLGASTEPLELAWLAPAALVVAVDFATYVDSGLARAAATFVVDDRQQFLHYRDAGYFPDYPDPSATLGEVADGAAGAEATEAASRDSVRPVLVTHLGVGLADILFAEAIARTALERGVGLELER